jgi:hypothetical protein
MKEALQAAIFAGAQQELPGLTASNIIYHIEI